MIRCLVIDDEPLAREGLCEYINQLDYLELVADVSDPVEALNFMSDHEVDLLFVDIQTPKLTGLEFIKSLPDPPMVIIATAYPSYALEGYELNVLDYLVKPITFQRFLVSTQKAKKQKSLEEKAVIESIEPEQIFIKVENKYIKLVLDDILFVKAMQNYVMIYTEEQEYLVLRSLKSMLDDLPNHAFFQVHKSYIINRNHIQSIEGNLLTIGLHKIPISRNLKSDVISELISDNFVNKDKGLIE